MNLPPHIAPAPEPAPAPEVGIFGTDVVIQAPFQHLTPDQAEDLAARLQEAAGEARGALLSLQAEATAANAHLTAAVPDLLKAAWQARAWILEAADHGYSQPSDITVGALNAAIAKAAGGGA